MNKPVRNFGAIFTSVAWMLALALGLETSSSIAIAKESAERCTVLTSGADLLGGFKTYISGKSLKMLMQNSKAYLVASAPSWRVVLYNPDNNSGISMPLKEWMAHTPQFTYLTTPPADELPFVWQQRDAESTKVLGRDCIKAHVYRHFKREPDSNDLEYVFLPDPAVSEVACNILKKLLNVPSSKGIPISFRLLSYDGRKTGGKFLYKTSKIEEGSQSEKFFSYPTNFKKAKREVEVVSDSNRNRLIEDTFGF